MSNARPLIVVNGKEKQVPDHSAIQHYTPTGIKSCITQTARRIAFFLSEEDKKYEGLIKSLECGLLILGVPKAELDNIISQAVNDCKYKF